LQLGCSKPVVQTT